MNRYAYFFIILFLSNLFAVSNIYSQTETHRAYYNTGQLKQEWTTIDGVVQGVEKKFYKSGVLESENFYVDGLLEGNCKWYYESGVLQAEWNYLAGKLEGVSKWYYENTKLEGVALYQNNDIISQTNYDSYGNETD